MLYRQGTCVVLGWGESTRCLFRPASAGVERVRLFGHVTSFDHGVYELLVADEEWRFRNSSHSHGLGLTGYGYGVNGLVFRDVQFA